MRALPSRPVLPGSPAGSAAGPPARLQLTSLVDMMVILVVFLLKSFAVEGQLVEPAAGLTLPTSSIQTPVPAGVVVEVGTRVVRVAGRDIVPTTALAAADTNTGAALKAALSLAMASSPEQASALIQADREVDYRHLSQVLRACAAAGWSDVSLVVLEVES